MRTSHIANTSPRVYLFFNRTNTSLGFPVGPGADPRSPFYGKYGYYYVRGNFNQPINGGAVGHPRQQLLRLHPGLLDGRGPADLQFRHPGREPVHPRVHGRPVSEATTTSPSSST
ncbi:MAG: hypothetical protein M0C28_05870 [Candidatus Moduliflexus flocculans]|nr:hypothetical protein [Candidatus Moduliflexus flocculans]